jgi:hypothetical protein
MLGEPSEEYERALFDRRRVVVVLQKLARDAVVDDIKALFRDPVGLVKHAGRVGARRHAPVGLARNLALGQILVLG